jgi:hypothetical protein
MITVQSRSPDYCTSRLWRTGEDRFAIQIREQLPDHSEIAAFGVERFDYREMQRFVGTKENLLRAGIVKADLFPDESTEEGRLTKRLRNSCEVGYYSFVLEETRRLCDNLWTYCHDSATARRAEAMRKDLERAHRHSFKSASDYRAVLLKHMELFESVVLDEYLSQDDRIYRLDEKSIAGIRAKIASLAAEIRSGTILTLGGAKPSLRVVVDNAPIEDR